MSTWATGLLDMLLINLEIHNPFHYRFNSLKHINIWKNRKTHQISVDASVNKDPGAILQASKSHIIGVSGS